MIIDIKGTRNSEVEVPAERYRFDAGQAFSRLPLLFGLGVAAILGFLKISYAEAKPVPVKEPPQPSEPEVATPPSRVGTLGTRPIHEEQQPQAQEPPALAAQTDGSQRLVATYDNVIPFPVRAHPLIDSPAIDFGEVAGVPVVGMPAPVASPSAGRRDAGSPEPAAGPPSRPGAPPVDPQRRNRPPEGRDAPIRLQEAFAGTAVLISTDQLLAQSSDPDGDHLAVKNVRVSSGSISATDAGFVFSSNAQAQPGLVLITFEVSDGSTSVVRTAFVELVRGPITGTTASDHLIGTNQADLIEGLAGADLVDAMDGDDTVVGGEGNDIIVAGDGNDVVRAMAGDDIVFGGNGDDVLSGGDGNDRLLGEAGDDILSGDSGDDSLSGGSGNDVASGGPGNDVVSGGDGEDVLEGGSGDDELQDGEGEDRAFGELGNDVVVAAMDAVADFFSGGEGFDTADFSAATASMTFDLAAGIATGTESGVDTLESFEALIGGSGGDIFMIGEHEMQLTGGDGEDTFIFAMPEHIDEPTLVHDILDFIVGDRIKIAAFEFTLEVEGAVEDRFGRYYRDREEDEAGALEMRIRHVADNEDRKFTVFEFDIDGNLDLEMTVTVQGHQRPFVYETATT